MQIFTTKKVDVYIHKKGSSCYGSDFNINWELEFEIREWGVKSLYFVAKNIEGSYCEEIEKGDDIEEFDRDFEYDFYNDDGWKVEHNLSFSEYGVFCPELIEIDLDGKTIDIS